MSHPQQSPTVHIEMLNDEVCLYDWERKQVHALNPTVAQVWQMCDGATSPAQMAEQLRANLNTELDARQAQALVWSALTQLNQAHLLQSELTLPTNQRLMTRRQMLKAGIALALVPVISTILAPSPVAAQSGNTQHGTRTFNINDGIQQFTVPTGVTKIVVDALGAQGGTVTVPVAPVANPGAQPKGGGLHNNYGGRVQAILTVTPGSTLYIEVGIKGSSGGSGGYGGGGQGGTSMNGNHGVGGGGASDVRQGGSGLNNRVIVAGGGGGYGGTGLQVAAVGGTGGAGGSTTSGGAGGNGDNGIDSVAPGAGTGGGGGTGGSTSGGNGGTSGNVVGTAGAQGNGGGGGSGTPTGGGGGGGGGGYYGGGGGGGGSGDAGGGGGGGGSSYADPGVTTGAIFTPDYKTGNGQVILTW